MLKLIERFKDKIEEEISHLGTPQAKAKGAEMKKKKKGREKDLKLRGPVEDTQHLTNRSSNREKGAHNKDKTEEETLEDKFPERKDTSFQIGRSTEDPEQWVKKTPL